MEDEGWAEDVSRHMKMGPRVQISVLHGNIHQTASSEEAQNNQVDEMTPSTDVSQPLSASFLEPECIRAPCSQQSTLHACKGAALDLYLRWASALPSRQTTILQPSGLQPGCTTASPGQLLKDAWPCLPQAKRGALGSTEAPR